MIPRSLLGVLTLTLVYVWVKTYNAHQRDWCGLRLFPRILLRWLPSAIVVCVIYYEIITLTNWEFLRPYFIPISGAAAFVAELIMNRILLSHQPSPNDLPASESGFQISVHAKIAAKKLQIVDTLEQDPNCQKKLLDMLSASTLSQRQVRAYNRRISDPPTRQQIFLVLNIVGVALAKTFISRR